MKLSKQRWSASRVRNMLALRTTKLSGKWNKVIKLICQNRKNVA